MDMVELLLLAAVREISGESVDLVAVTRRTLNSLIDEKSLFEKLPENISVNFIPKKNGRNLLEITTDSYEEYYEHRALILYDGVAAAALGRWSYIYKCKGVRVYLFESGDISVLTPHCKIDEYGFSLANELCDAPFEFRVSTLSQADLVSDLFEMISDRDPNFLPEPYVGIGLIKMITNIRSKFIKDYYLEYVLTPPDVDILSDFSTQVRRELWDVCFSRDFERKVGPNLHSQSIELLMGAGISPEPEQILFYLQSVRRDSSPEMLFRRMDELERAIHGRFNQLSQDLKSPEFWSTLSDKQKRQISEVTRYYQRRPSAKTAGDVVLEVLRIFKIQVEDRGLWKELWEGAKPKHERSVQNLFFSSAVSFCAAYDLDISPESNGGNGPVDFKVSGGWHDKVVVEFKLSTNSSAVHGYETQLELYKVSEGLVHGIFVLIDVGRLGDKLTQIHEIQDANGDTASDVIYIDARRKASASKRR
nr:hypothetical protein [uncultured Pseudomonas sp.]